MQPNHQPNIAMSSATEVASFGISKNDEAHVMGILRDQIYSDKIMAVVREYVTNAWDANRAAGKRDVPVQVHLPEDNDLELRVSDCGPGLSREDVFSVYTQYGASTKRDTDDQIGMLGIGCKSVFSYTDQFTVVSRHGGVKSTYVCALDESDKGVVQLLGEEPCETSGVEVRVLCKASDVYEFRARTETLFPHLVPCPEVNLVVPSLNEDGDVFCRFDGGDPDRTHHARVRPKSGTWFVVMGGVPYYIKMAQLNLPEAHQVLYQLSGFVYLPIGAVQFAASREELRYTPKTMTALGRAFDQIVDSLLKYYLDKLNEEMLPLQKRALAREVVRLGFTLPEDFEDLAAANVKLFDNEVEFGLTVTHMDHQVSHLPVKEDVKLLLDDTHKPLRGYYLGSGGYVVRAAGGKCTVDELRARVDKMLDKCLLTGLPVGKLSEYPWHPKRGVRAGRDKTHNPKHKAKVFRRIPGKHYGTQSMNWEIVSRVADPNDLCVVIDRFEGVGPFDSVYAKDAKIAAALGLQLPEVYGYKLGKKDPIGVSYVEWSAAWRKHLLTEDLIKELATLAWSMAYSSEGEQVLRVIAPRLPEDHAIAKLLERAKYDYTRCDKLMPLIQALGFDRTKRDEVRAELAEIDRQYPLLQYLDGSSSAYAAATDYVLLVDRNNSNTNPVTGAIP